MIATRIIEPPHMATFRQDDLQYYVANNNGHNVHHHHHHHHTSQPTFPRYDVQSRGLSYAQHELLRQRKTPHGRMIEQEEPESFDHTLQLPASKHVLLSQSPRSYHPIGQQSRDSGQLPQSWQPLGGVDSVLHQNTTSILPGSRYHVQVDSQVPIALPTAFHAHLGPTASAAQQFYGPYWPDGTFSPYRPAPIRDNRYMNRHAAGYTIDNRTLRPYNRLINTNVVPPPYYEPPSATRFEISRMSDKIAFRDRTFTWAHQVYVDLLTRIQREGRIVHKGSAHGRSVSKPAIFPKPPQRTTSHFKEDFHPDAMASTTTILAPSRRGSEPMSVFSSSKTLPSMAVVSALETMELLCHEAETPWTDGMLLAGCLAYGLGDYGKALFWYQKILYSDTDHVEAISNLAATLLALNRRDEALQHWSTAVRLRPSYFEAVEHLIGLLCACARPREAVEVLNHVQSSLRIPLDEIDSRSRSSSSTTAASHDIGHHDYDIDRRLSTSSEQSDHRSSNGFGSSGYAIPGSENGRLLALIHAKGNMLYALGDNDGAAICFEDAILVATNKRVDGIKELIHQILRSCISGVEPATSSILASDCKDPILLSPERAQHTAQRLFPPHGELPGLEFVAPGMSVKAAVSTTSNSLLSLAKIYQDGLGNTNGNRNSSRRSQGTREILALYYLSLSLQRSPSTANNVGILLAGVQQTTHTQVVSQCLNNDIINYTGIAPGSGVGLALQYYNYGLNIDPRHAHLYTNLGSLLKDLGQLTSAIKMYTKAVEFDPKFDIALANLANAVKDQGRIADAITYYRRAVQANPDFAEAVCGLATALNSVCSWFGRGGVYADDGERDKIHVDDFGMMQKAKKGSGLMNRVVEIVEKQLVEGETWGRGVLSPVIIEDLCHQLGIIKGNLSRESQHHFHRELAVTLSGWSGQKWEGSRIVKLVERATRCIGWQWYQDLYRHKREYSRRRYARPLLPSSLASPTAPTVLPFHTFTTPLSAKQVRQISQRNALRISVSTLRSSWLPTTVYPPPKPPAPCLRVGYVSSDFNNHPLAHLMQSVFGLHDKTSVRAYCYATTNSDGSVHRQQIEREAPVFYNAASWSIEKLVNCIVEDGIHILVNLNGYTRGARNEVFAARPAPIHMSFMGFAGTLGAEWCDYVFADPISVLPKTLSPRRRNVNVEDLFHPDALLEDSEDWMYAENVIFARSTFFCVDHKQSSPDAKIGPPMIGDSTTHEMLWQAEQGRRWRMRKELFPNLPDTAVIMGNFNQLYKIDPATFRLYLRILGQVPNAVLWLLRFPDAGEQNLMTFARNWAGPAVAGRVIFTDVAPKEQHILRASVVDIFLDTPECNAHTTAADVIWSGTPIVTWARWEYKMCSRMASSIVASALPEGKAGDRARAELLVNSEEEYERQAVHLASGLFYQPGSFDGGGTGRLLELRRILWETRWTSRLFDTTRWVRDLESAYWKAWHKWETGEGGDIWL